MYVCLSMYVWLCEYGYVCMAMYVWLCMHGYVFILFLVSFVEERLWWPIQSPNIGGNKKASS